MNEDRWSTWIEVASVAIIIATVFALAVPKSGEVQRARTAQEVLSDVETMRKAVYRFYSDSAYFPVQATDQQLPEGLRPYLPSGYAMTRRYGSLDYRNWPLAVTDTLLTKASNVVGVTVTVTDPRIGAAAAARSGDVSRFVIRNKYTFLFFGS